MSKETWQCWSCGADFTVEEHSDADGECPRCGVEVDLVPLLQARCDALQALLNEKDAEIDRLSSAVDLLAELYNGTCLTGQPQPDGWPRRLKLHVRQVLQRNGYQLQPYEGRFGSALRAVRK